MAVVARNTRNLARKAPTPTAYPSETPRGRRRHRDGMPAPHRRLRTPVFEALTRRAVDLMHDDIACVGRMRMFGAGRVQYDGVQLR